MAIGPVEYIIVGFPGNKFNGEIAPELGKLVESGTIRILDLVFITKDADGNVAAIEFEDHDDVALFAALDGEVGGLISEEDIEYAGRRRSSRTRRPPCSSGRTSGRRRSSRRCATRAACCIEGSRIPHDLIEAGRGRAGVRRLTSPHRRN